jgi:hypothetical protein
MPGGSFGRGRPFAGLQDQPGDVLGSGERELARDADIGVGSEHDAAVPELITDDLQVRPGGQRKGGRAVPQIMQSYWRQVGGGDEIPEGPGEVVR